MKKTIKSFKWLLEEFQKWDIIILVCIAFVMTVSVYNLFISKQSYSAVEVGFWQATVLGHMIIGFFSTLVSRKDSKLRQSMLDFVKEIVADSIEFQKELAALIKGEKKSNIKN